MIIVSRIWDVKSNHFFLILQIICNIELMYIENMCILIGSALCFAWSTLALFDRVTYHEEGRALMMHMPEELLVTSE